MDYQTYPPHSELSLFVKCFWTLESPAESPSEKQRIIPDGCVEMLFHYRDFYKQYLEGGEVIVQPKCFVFGQVTKPLYIEPTGATGIFAVRFLPDGFMPFIATAVTAMENRAVPLAELFGSEGNLLADTVLNAGDTTERIAIVEAFLRSKLVSQAAADTLIKSCIEAILRLDGQASVEELAEQLSVNRRQLERKFASSVGLSPKQLSKIIRLQATLEKMAAGSGSLTEVGHEGNYYDQAHFIKDFREFTGKTPKQFYAGSLAISMLFAKKR